MSRKSAKARGKTREYDISPEQEQEIRDAFSLFDKGDGVISTRDVRIAMRALGITEEDRAQMASIMTTLDPDKSGIVEMEQFVRVMALKLADRDTKEEVAKAFELFDQDGTGRITFKNLKRIAKELNEPLSDADIKEMLAGASSREDNQVTLADFERIMTKAGLI